MQLAADLHLHSRYASAVSKLMTLENISLMARRKGVDLSGTGDCLQPKWLEELEAGLRPVKDQPGFFALTRELGEAAARQLPEKLRRPLRFLLSTEIHCSPPGTAELRGPHHLVYFTTFESAWAFHKKLLPYGDLNEGRPRVRLTSAQLLEMVLDQGDGCQFAPAHWLNPFFSICGSQGGGSGSLEDHFGALASHVTLIETGLTSTPLMCRRVAGLDGRFLFSNSDAHSLENIGREVTLIEGAHDFETVFAALRGGRANRVTDTSANGTENGSGGGNQNQRSMTDVGENPNSAPSCARVVGTVKYPIERTRYFRNWCGICQHSIEGEKCTTCGRPLAMGARDRVEQIASRTKPLFPTDAAPPWLMVLPLAEALSDLLGVDDGSKAVQQQHARLLEALGHERYILTEATFDEIARVGTAQLARFIVGQRTTPVGQKPVKSKREAAKSDDDSQFSLL